jgi:diaminohydroxyphosphoribosylaminopyrimidine deaminase/5-amino-6-(5-phosphoribosylamino)uracil reductase
MSRALQLAHLGRYTCQPNPRVGCVIVKDNRIIGEGSHLKAGKEHAEIAALNQAGDGAKGAVCYVTLEPCAHTGRTPPCTDTLIKSEVTSVFAAMVDPDPRVAGEGFKILQDSGINTHSGLMEDQAIAMNRGYCKRMKHGIPWVRCKIAMSLDGKSALSSGQSKWITSEQSRLDVQSLRAESCAVITGTGTVLADDPGMNVRDIDTLGRQPLRVLIDRQLRTPKWAKIFDKPGKVRIYTTVDDKDYTKSLNNKSAQLICLDGDNTFLKSVLRHLADEEQVNEVLIEAGPSLSGAFLDLGLIDELIVYQAPLILGNKAQGILAIKERLKLDDRIKLDLKDIRHIGEDIKITCEIIK